MVSDRAGPESAPARQSDARGKLPVSVAIITLDEERHIGAALESVDWAKEVVVVDSGSSDRTVEICRQAGARVEQRAWQGFSKQKNAAIDLCSCDWVLSLDADERVSPALAEELRSLFAERPRRDGYRIPRISLFLGRWMRHCGWWPDFSIRLFDRRKGRFGDRAVHESVQLAGTTARMRNPLFHHSYPDVIGYFERLNRYSTLAAQEMFEGGRRFRWHNPFVKPVVAFFRLYLWRRGFLEGWHGLFLSALNSFYVLAKYMKLWALGNSPEEPAPPPGMQATARGWWKSEE